MTVGLVFIISVTHDQANVHNYSICTVLYIFINSVYKHKQLLYICISYVTAVRYVSAINHPSRDLLQKHTLTAMT